MKDQNLKLLSELLNRLQTNRTVSPMKKVFVGFDGFVDKIMKAVQQKKNYQNVYFKTIPEFASIVNSASGKSGQVELVMERIKLGGNAPILSNTLGRLGVHSFCAGSLGYPERHGVFEDMDSKCEVISLQNPGDSTAIEFIDGKIILSELSVFDDYDWEFIKKTHGIEKIRRAILESSIVALVDWVNLPYSSEIWEGVLRDIIKPSGRKDFYFFFDLCDPSKKTTHQVDEILDLMSCFSSYGKVTLGVNENETLKIWCAINGIDFNDPSSKAQIPDVMLAGDRLCKAMNVDCILVHPTDRAIAFRQHEIIELTGRLVNRPKVLTGGGDNLNAGYCLGILLEFSVQHCMLLGMATSGAYIQNGTSPGIQEIIDYIRVWIDELQKSQVTKPIHVFTHRHE